jgi:hypothetical protein
MAAMEPGMAFSIGMSGHSVRRVLTSQSTACKGSAEGLLSHIRFFISEPLKKLKQRKGIPK